MNTLLRNFERSLRSRVPRFLRMWIAPCRLLACCSLTLLVAGVGDLPANDSQAVQEAQRALSRTGQPWYDSSEDAARAIQGADLHVDPSRSDWRLPKARNWDWNWAPTGNWQWLGELMKYLAWGLLIALLAFLIYALVQAYLNSNPIQPHRRFPDAAQQEALSDEERVANLPVKLRSQGDFLSIAGELYSEGRFGEAMVYLFSHRLIQLDRAGCIRLSKGKTNRQYLAELRRHRDLQRMLGQTIVPFEDFFFGQHMLSENRFRQCWDGNDRFVELIAQVQA